MLPYFVLISIFVLLSEIKYKEKYVLRHIALLFLILFIGLRRDVGADYFSYKNVFESSDLITWEYSSVEIGYLYLNKAVLFLFHDFRALTLIHAFLVVFFLHLSLRMSKYYTFAFLLFILTEPGYIFIVNGMRQGLAMAIFFYACKFIQSKEPFKYWTCILLGASFHLSILFVSPCYWILQKKLSYNIYCLIPFLTFGLFYSGKMNGILLSMLEYTPYAHYLTTQFIDSTVNGGYGYLFGRVGSFFILFYYGKLLERFPQYMVYFNLYFLSVLSKDLLGNIQVLARMSLYFNWSVFFVYPLFFSFLFKSNSYRLVQLYVVFVYLVFFVYRVYMDVDNHLLYMLPWD